MTILAVGDVHGNFLRLRAALEQVPEDAYESIIQVGDLGAWPPELYPDATPWTALSKPVYFVRGNHDYEPELVDLETPTEIRPGLTFMPSGWVEEIDGRLVGFLGGAESVVDRNWRTPGKNWWPSEAVTEEQVQRLLWAGPLDLLVTHEAPASVVRAHFGFEPSKSARLVEAAWEAMGRPRLICGHHHRHVVVPPVQVLDILEMVLI